jgi:hypothetical protein
MFVHAGEPLPLVNPGFEEGDAGWRFKETTPMSTVTGDAAYDGVSGLRVEDRDSVDGSNVVSGMIPVVAGTEYVLTFWSRSSSPPPLAGVFLWYYSPDKKLIEQKDRPVSMVSTGDGKWHQRTLAFTVPEGVAYIALWVHSLGKATGIVDFDAFELRQSVE